MKKGAWIGLMMSCLLLTGCASLLTRQYGTVEPHSSKYWESEDSDTLRAETYQDVVNDLLILVGQRKEEAVVRLYHYEDDLTVSQTLEQAAAEVQQDTPMGAYAVEYIASESKAQRGYYECTIRISYRRTSEQMEAIVNATSTAALEDLLDTALDAGKSELAVRVSYWEAEDQNRVNEAVAAVRARREPSDAAWTVSYYPATGHVGIIEFLLQPVEDEALLEGEKQAPAGNALVP